VSRARTIYIGANCAHLIVTCASCILEDFGLLGTSGGNPASFLAGLMDIHRLMASEKLVEPQ